MSTETPGSSPLDAATPAFRALIDAAALHVTPDQRFTLHLNEGPGGQRHTWQDGRVTTTPGQPHLALDARARIHPVISTGEHPEFTPAGRVSHVTAHACTRAHRIDLSPPHHPEPLTALLAVILRQRLARAAQITVISETRGGMFTVQLTPNVRGTHVTLTVVRDDLPPRSGTLGINSMISLVRTLRDLPKRKKLYTPAYLDAFARTTQIFTERGRAHAAAHVTLTALLLPQRQRADPHDPPWERYHTEPWFGWPRTLASTPDHIGTSTTPTGSHVVLTVINPSGTRTEHTLHPEFCVLLHEYLHNPGQNAEFTVTTQHGLTRARIQNEYRGGVSFAFTTASPAPALTLCHVPPGHLYLLQLACDAVTTAHLREIGRAHV